MSSDRSDDPKYVAWARAVKVKYNFCCNICGISGLNNGIYLESHHLNSFDWAVDERYNISNSACLCEYHHVLFHKVYGFGQNTKAQYCEYEKLCKAFLKIIAENSTDKNPENPSSSIGETDPIKQDE